MSIKTRIIYITYINNNTNTIIQFCFQPKEILCLN